VTGSTLLLRNMALFRASGGRRREAVQLERHTNQLIEQDRARLCNFPCGSNVDLL